MPAKCDVLVLAGDLGVGDQAIHFLLNIAIALDGTHVVWIAGNHAFYRTNIDRQKNPYRAIYHEMRRINFFENEVVEINGYQFLRCTLWSGFNAYSDVNVRLSARNVFY